MTKIYDENWREVSDYIGHRYDDQIKPLMVYLYVNPTGEVYFDTGDVNCWSQSINDNRAIRFCLREGFYSKKYCESIIDDYKLLLQKLVDSYEENWNGNNYIGQWDEKIVEELENICWDLYPDLTEGADDNDEN